jgi:hypothetical protein
MAIVDKIVAPLQSMLGVVGSEIEELGKTTGLIKRRRKFSACSLLQMLVLTLLKKPRAKLIDYQKTAAQLGVFVTQEAIDKRFSKELAAFLRGAIERALRPALVITGPRAKLLQEFTSVRIGDSTIVPLPDEFADEFPGCGGKSQSGRAAMKIQFLWDLLAGGILSLVIEPGSQSDAKSPIAQLAAPAGSLTIFDLGYFCLERFRRLGQGRAYWISRFQPGTSVYTIDGESLDLRRYLREHGGSGLVDIAILLGAAERLPCRLIAVRVPQEKANRRRQKAVEKAEKHGRVPSREYLEMQDWNVFVTNCEADRLTWKEVIILYRARWQIELLFKLWKSHNGLAEHKPGASAVQKLAVIYAKLMAIIVQHWILIGTSWGNADRSLMKGAEVLEEWITSIADALGDRSRLTSVLEKAMAVIEAVARIKKRRANPSSFQLLETPELLDYTFS